MSKLTNLASRLPKSTSILFVNERIPDLSFVAADRIPAEGIPDGVWQIPHDLAFEVISPNDLHEKVRNKLLSFEVWG